MATAVRHLRSEAEVRSLILRYRSGDGRACEQLVVHHLPLVEALARRFVSKDEVLDDLVQVAVIGLLKAVKRFDPERGRPFAAFAMPTILGELRHHVRDRTWPVRIPRRIRRLEAELEEPARRLSGRLARSPTPSELAHELGVSERRVARALEVRGAQSVVPLPESAAEGSAGDGVAASEDRLLVEAGLRLLDERRRTIVRRYFLDGWSQVEIARELGISQIHVSRLLRDALGAMRKQLGERPAA